MLTGEQGMERGIAFRNIAFARKDIRGKEVLIFKELDADFKSGQVSFIQGAVGVGKSTLLHLAAGLMRPDAGEILAHGVPISRYPASFRDNWRKSVGIVFQHLKLFSGLTVRENVMLPLMPRPKQALSSAKDRCNKLLEQLDLAWAINRPAGTLSGGERQRVAVARALAGDPDFIIADEPFAHQDETGVARIYQLFLAAANNGKTVLVAAHALSADLPTCVERRFTLDRGQVVPAASLSEGESKASEERI